MRLGLVVVIRGSSSAGDPVEDVPGPHGDLLQGCVVLDAAEEPVEDLLASDPFLLCGVVASALQRRSGTRR
jgi:hypothetical protein